MYLKAQGSLPFGSQARSLAIFVLVRGLVTGLFGGLVASLGAILIDVQTILWLVFGLVYLTIALSLMTGRPRFPSIPIRLAPQRWREARNPILLGLAFGLSIPACAAPILFGLLGLAASFGAVAAGFLMMFLFGFALSLPLALFLMVPGFTGHLDALRERARSMRVPAGLAFAGVGLWSIWFGLFVDPADWVLR